MLEQQNKYECSILSRKTSLFKSIITNTLNSHQFCRIRPTCVTIVELKQKPEYQFLFEYCPPVETLKRYYDFQTNLDKQMQVENRKKQIKNLFFNVIFTRVFPVKGFEKIYLQFYRDSPAKAASRFAKDRSKRFTQTWSSKIIQNFICFK